MQLGQIHTNFIQVWYEIHHLEFGVNLVQINVNSHKVGPSNTEYVETGGSLKP